MNIVWGVILLFFSLLAWLGQVTSVVSPDLAVRIGLMEPEADVDPVFFADIRGEAIWDALTLWTLPVAGVLFLMSNPWWPYWGLVGGGMYVYFTGRGITQRLVMRRRGIRIGNPALLKGYLGMLGLWGLIALVTIVMAAIAL